MISYLAFPPIDVDVFPTSYGSARIAFCDLAGCFARINAKLESYACPGKTPEGEELFTDTLWLGPEHAAKVLVLLGGTHGVEGFVGSAVEFDFIRLVAGGEIILPDNQAVLIVHALTPWGYARLRRCDDNGVDLNRNEIDFSRPLPENPGYDQLKAALFSDDDEYRLSMFDEYEKQFGRTAFEIAVSGGQYNDPSGPFYGGAAPAHGRLVSEDLISRHSLAERDLGVIDLHSGLGPYGYGEIICDHPPGNPGIAVAQRWYGDAVTLPALGTSSSVPKLGLMDYLWHRTMNARSCHVTLEFGTYATDDLFNVIRKDHQLWAQSVDPTERTAHSRKMQRHFCPDDTAWKASVLFRARQVIAQALEGLQS